MKTFFQLAMIAITTSLGLIEALSVPPQNSTALQLSADNHGREMNLQDNVPDDFQVEFQTIRSPQKADINDIWAAMIDLLYDNTLSGFQDPSKGADIQRGPMKIRVRPFPYNKSLVFQNCHVIWAIQRLAERLHRTRDYNEVTGTILIRDPQTLRLTEIGAVYFELIRIPGSNRPNPSNGTTISSNVTTIPGNETMVSSNTPTIPVDEPNTTTNESPIQTSPPSNLSIIDIPAQVNITNIIPFGLSNNREAASISFASHGVTPFDFVFVDDYKRLIIKYVEGCLSMIHVLARLLAQPSFPTSYKYQDPETKVSFAYQKTSYQPEFKLATWEMATLLSVFWQAYIRAGMEVKPKKPLLFNLRANLVEKGGKKELLGYMVFAKKSKIGDDEE